MMGSSLLIHQPFANRGDTEQLLSGMTQNYTVCTWPNGTADPAVPFPDSSQLEAQGWKTLK